MSRKRAGVLELNTASARQPTFSEMVMPNLSSQGHTFNVSPFGTNHTNHPETAFESTPKEFSFGLATATTPTKNPFENVSMNTTLISGQPKP